MLVLQALYKIYVKKRVTYLKIILARLMNICVRSTDEEVLNMLGLSTFDEAKMFVETNKYFNAAENGVVFNKRDIQTAVFFGQCMDNLEFYVDPHPSTLSQGELRLIMSGVDRQITRYVSGNCIVVHNIDTGDIFAVFEQTDQRLFSLDKRCTYDMIVCYMSEKVNLRFMDGLRLRTFCYQGGSRYECVNFQLSHPELLVSASLNWITDADMSHCVNLENLLI